MSFQCKKCFKQSCLPIKSLPITMPMITFNITSLMLVLCLHQNPGPKNKASFRFTQMPDFKDQWKKKHANKKSMFSNLDVPSSANDPTYRPLKTNGWNLKITCVEKEDQSSLSPPIVGFKMLVFREVYGCFLKWWYPQTTPK